MRFLPKRDIKNNTYITLLKPLEFGTNSMTSIQELEMLKDTPQILRYVDIDFTGKFKVLDGLPVISTEDDAVEISLALNNQEFLIDENFEVSLSVDANKIASSEVDGVVFTTKQLVAQAKIILYETKVLERIETLLDEARAHINKFEETTEVNL